MSVSIKPKSIESSELDECATVLPDREIASGRIGAKRYIILGDGVHEAKDLPRFLAADADWTGGDYNHANENANLFEGMVSAL